MKKSLLIYLLTSLLLSSFAADQDVASCSQLPNSNHQSKQDKNKELLNYCEQDIYGSKRYNAKERKQRKERENHYRKECKKKAKAYKKAVAKSLLKKLKLSQGIQALFKRKKDMVRIKFSRGKYKKNQKKIKSSLNTQEIANLESGKLSKKEFSEFVIDKIRKEIPNIDQLMQQSKRKSTYKQNFSQNEVYPINLVVKTDGKESCIIKSEDFPKEEPFNPKDCELCQLQTVQNNFTNDCAYMISSDFSEKEARKLVGAKKMTLKNLLSKKGVKQDSHCNHDMNSVSNDMSNINKTVEKLCHIAKMGRIPKFKIETTRNEYKDKTKDLAHKRGVFTQKYIYKRLREKSKYCDLSQLDQLPSWLKSEKEFKKHVYTKAPEYKRPNAQAGSYGPKPNAQGLEQEKEKQYLTNTLKFEMNHLVKNKENAQKRINEIEAQIQTTQQEINKRKKSYQAIEKADISANSIAESVKLKTQALTDISREAMQLYSNKKKLQQEKFNLTEKIKGIQQQLKSKRFSKTPSGNFQLAEKLHRFYKSNKRDKKRWNEILFNQFKMARITEEIETEENAFGFDKKLITPQLSGILNTLVEIDTFTCELKPVRTKKTSLKGVLTAPLKIVTAITLPAGAIIAGIGGTINRACRGCLTPGQRPPKLSVDLSKAGFQRGWRNIKEATDNYIHWGNLLRVRKKKYYTKHHLDKYKSKSYGQQSSNNESCFNGTRNTPKTNSAKPVKSSSSNTIVKEQ